MSTGFHDPIAPKMKPSKVKNESYTIKNPPYDNRTSCSVHAGQDYGVGHRQPVGTEKQTGKSPIPYGRPKTLNVYEY